VNKASFYAPIDRARTDTGERCGFLRLNQGNIVGTFAAPALNRTSCSADDQQLPRFNGDLDFSSHRAQAFPAVSLPSVALVYQRD